MLESEAHDRDHEPRARRPAARDACEHVAQLVHGHRRGVHDVVGHASHRLHRLALFADALDGGTVGRQRVRPARLAEPAHQGGLGRLEKDEHRIQAPHLLQATVDAREVREQLSLADVDDDGRARDLAAGAQRQLGQHRKQRDREVVDAEVPKVLERANRLRFARAREARQHDKPRANGRARRPPCRVPFLFHLAPSPASP